MREFIRDNREEIDRHIESVCPDAPKTDHERELWIRNDEQLYLMAIGAGVKV